MTAWICTTELAILAVISERKARLALMRGAKDRLCWRGATLTVRTIRGRGGRSGLCYEVLVSSLPLDLQERFNASLRQDLGPFDPATGSGAERDWWHHILGPALKHPKHSKERGAAIAAILARPLTDWTGKAISPSRRTIERQINAYELHGLSGLTPQHRKDRGKAKVIISAAWDRAISFSPQVREEIAGRLRDYIRGLYKDGATVGRIGQLTTEKLKSLTHTYFERMNEKGSIAGLVFPEGTFHIPRTFIEAQAHCRLVSTYRRDRKSYEDTQRPRISRTIDGLLPMDIVVGDVHHLDIVMRREDGSEAWPKAIAWVDMATRRIRMDIILLEKGEGVRNADVIRSFIAMTQDPAWGMPRRLYLDNGSEYRWAEFVDDAMKLVRDHLGLTSIEYLDRAVGSSTIRARPYNASAKVIEGIFGTLEQHYFRTIQGWAGGDRTNRKTAKVGRPTEPFAGDIDALRTVIGAYLNAYEAMPQKGQLKGRAPAAIYRMAVEDGWQRVTMDLNDLRSVFAVEKPAKLRQGVISHGGRKWTCDGLITHLDQTVMIRIPKFEDPTVLPILDRAGTLIGFAEPEERYGVTDRRGAREASRRANLRAKAVRQLDRSIPDVSTTEEVRKLAAALPPLPAAPVAGTISVNPQIAAGLAETPEERAERLRLEKQRAGMDDRARVDSLHKLLFGGR